MLSRLRNALVRTAVRTVVSAHCDLPCGVYDPAQARIEAESIKMIIGKVADNNDPDFRTRAILIKEQRAELVRHVKKQGEEAKVAVRAVRQDARKQIAARGRGSAASACRCCSRS